MQNRLTLAAVCVAASLLAAQTIPFTPVFRISDPAPVVCGALENATPTLHFPALPARQGMTAVLKVDLRLLDRHFGGWGNWTAIELNGQELAPANAQEQIRLLGRGGILHTTQPRERAVPYWQKTGRHLLMTYFAPADARTVDPRITDKEFGFDYYLDIDDLVSKRTVGADSRVENDAGNRLRFINALPRHVVDTALLVKGIEIGYVPTARLNALKGIREWSAPRIPAAAALPAGVCTVKVFPAGGMELSFGEAGSLFVESGFGYPATPEMGYNRLLVARKPTGEQGIEVSVERKGASLVVQMRAKTHEVERIITPQGQRIAVTDKITNRTAAELGLIWRNDFALDRRMPANGWRLSGLTRQSAANIKSAANPTIFIEDKRFAVGIVAEDSISRILLNNYANGNVFTLSTRGVGLTAKQTLTVEWSVYPLAAPETAYFDFINRVRSDWGVNHTIPGPFLFDATQKRPGLAARLACVPPWFEYANGFGLTREQYKALVLSRFAEARRLHPGVKLMPLVETNLVPFPADAVPWGMELPLTYGNRKDPRSRYGLSLSPELTRKLLAATPYRDSLLFDASGNVIVDTFYPSGQRPLINLMPQVEKGNHRYNVFLDQIKFLMEEIKADGIYIDQFNPSMHDGISYDRWDGRSVDIDKTGRITRKFYNYAITGAEARAEIVKRIRAYGGCVLTNGHPVTREERGIGRLSFEEMENDDCNPLPFLDKKPPEFRFQALGHLSSPVILNLRPRRFQRLLPAGSPDLTARILNKGIITALRNGVLPYYYTIDIPADGPSAGGFDVSAWLFPFTPVKLGEGVLVGRERTIVCISGAYRMTCQGRPEVAHFNNVGLATDHRNITVSGKPGDWTVAVKLDDWNEVAVFASQ